MPGLSPRWRWLLATAALSSLAAVAGIGARATYGARTSGDEPQYLLSALSLGDDGDLDISDELRDEAYRPFSEIGVDRQTTPLDPSGRQVSPHDPLLPIVLAPATALGGWSAAKATLAAVAGAVAAAAMWVSVRRFGVRPPVAALVVASTSVAVPLAPYGSQIYPELPAALVVLLVVAALTSARCDLARTSLVVAGLIALPWLSVKYLPVGLVLGVGFLAWSRRERGLQVLAVVVLAVAGAAYLWLHHRIYGGWTVYAAGDHFADTGELSVVGTRVDLAGRARRLAGLLVDRHFGIGPWAPVWFLAPVAVAALARRRPPGGVLLVAALAVGWLNATFVALTMHGWWVPGRQIVIVLPLAAVAMAWFVDRRPVLVVPVALAGAVGALNWLWLAAEASTGRRALIVDFAATAAPTYRLVRPLFPDGMNPTSDLALVVGWSVAALALLVLGWRCSDRGTAGHLPNRHDAAGSEVRPSPARGQLEGGRVRRLVRGRSAVPQP